MEELKYQYKNAPIPGGGYATGFLFQPAVPGLLYLRTDIGGTYRFEADRDVWVSLMDHVTMEDRSETYPIAVAVDARHPDKVYIASGIWGQPTGKLSVSYDRGEHFEHYEMPMPIHGNMPGRGTGSRLIVDAKNQNLLYYASQLSGLWKSTDAGKTWDKLDSMPEDYLTFVGQSPDGTVLFVGSAGVTTQVNDDNCGPAIYASYDGGNTFETLQQPEYLGPKNIEGDKKVLRGLVAQRYAVDEKYLYVTFASRCNSGFRQELDYSCDAHMVSDGHVARYPWTAQTVAGEMVTKIDTMQEITPMPEQRTLPKVPGASKPCHHFGFSGIDVCRKVPGMLVCTTIRKGRGDSIYRSLDYGETWQEILHDLDKGKLTFRTSYMKPEFNGNHSMVHWMSDFKIDPNNPDRGWFNTGSGVFRTNNLREETVEFTDWSDGLEETVHINVYAPTAGETLLIDILGDLGGFAFRDLTKPCDNSFADEMGNRYITCMNADYSDLDPHLVAVTPRGNWTGHTKGGLIISHDNCRTFERLPMPYGITEEIDEALAAIEKPNVNSGFVAMSPDGRNLVWSIAKRIQLPVHLVVVSHDGGLHFAQVKVYDLEGQQITEGSLKVFSDRVNSQIFYGFGNHSQVYLSLDGGASFHQIPVDGLEEDIEFTLIDCTDQSEVRVEGGKSGVLYFSAREKGLWKLVVDTASGCAAAQRLSSPGDAFYGLGLGLLRPEGDYFAEEKALYVSACIRGEYGFFRSLDQGKTFQKLNNAQQCFGDIHSVDADKRVFGRFFIGTGSRGVLYGEPC